MNNFQMETPLDQRERLRALERQREPALKKRLGDELDRERPFVLERERAASLSERMLERGRMGDRMVGLSRFVEREREVRERSVGADRRLDPVVGLSRLESSAGASRLESGVGTDRRLDGGVERRMETAGGMNEDREVIRAGVRPSFERLRPADRERDEGREKTRDKARDDDVALEREKQKDDSVGAWQELVAQYKTALGELTFNSKPIITNLTIIAGENAHAAKAIAATVCAHVLEVPNEQKLPSLYLLDSIVKNIGGEYVKHFAASLCEVFCTAYRQVDSSTHPSMQHLFRTWRGVFPGSPLRMIETELEFTPMSNGPSSTSNSARPVDSPSQRPGHSIHVNPKYIQAQRHRLQQSSRTEAASLESNGDASNREGERSERVGLDSPKSWPDAPKRPLSSRSRSDSFANDSGYNQKTPSSFSDYDYTSSDLGADTGGGRILDREEPWERVWPREGEDIFRIPDSASVLRMPETASVLRMPETTSVLRMPESVSGLRFGQRNGYESTQPSARALVDAYGNIRGPRAPRMPPPPAQPAQDLDRSRGPPRNWKNSEEEEYIWENMSPMSLEHTRLRDTVRKDDWRSSDIDKSIIPGGSGRVKPLGLDQHVSNHLGFRRHGAMPLTERPLSVESRLLPRREVDERISLSGLQQDIGVGAMPDSALEVPVLGSNFRSALGHGPLGSRLPHSRSQQLSPPAQSRLRPLQVSMLNRNPTDVGSFDSFSQSTNLSVPLPNSTLSMGLSAGIRGSIRQAVGPFGSSLLNFGSLSPVTPASSLLSQQRQPQRHPSPPPPPLNPPSQSQLLSLPSTPPPSIPPNFQRISHLKPPGQLPGMPQSYSSQQPPLHPVPQQQQQQQPISQLPSQPQAIQQVPQQLPPLQPALQQQPMPRSQANSEQQLPSQQQQPSQTIPALPLLPPHLLQSLQQLQNHLPPFPGSSMQQPQASQSSQQTQVAPPSIQQSQPVQVLQQAQPQQQQQQQQQQLPLQPQPPQQSGYVAQSTSPVVNETGSSSVCASQSQQGQSSSSSLLAAFLQSGIMPPSQASQILSHPRPPSPKVSPGSTESIAAQPSPLRQPPLPSGPPPFQFSNSSGAGSAATQGVLSLPPAATNLTPLPVPMSPALAPVPPAPPSANLSTFVSQPMRMVQPPLPPGPPPVSSQVISSATPPLVSGGTMPSMNNFSSLLSSLMAQGIISGPSSSAPPAIFQHGAAIGNSSSSVPGALPNSSPSPLFSGATGKPPTGPSVGAIGAITAMPAILAAALQTQIPSATSGDASTDQKNITVDPIGTEFKQDFLRERHEVVINALYSDFPRQCKTCGLRFKYQEEHSKHMDWHVTRNRRQKAQKKVSRKWFVSVKEWLSGTGASGSEVAPSFFPEEVAVKSEEHEQVAVPADENQSACALCGEPFEDFYSDETEEWMYKGAVYMNILPGGATEGLDSSLLGPIVHAKCRSESVATAAVDSAEDDEMEEEDDLRRRRKKARY